VGGTEYKSYSIDKGLISPQLAWSLTKNLVDGKGVKPWLTVDLDFNRDYGKAEAYTPDGGNYVVSESIVVSNNSIVPKLGLGLGGLTIAEKGGFRATLDLDYALAIGTYSNEYNYTEDGKHKIGTINGLVSGGSYYEIGYNTHLVTPSIAGSWNSDKLRLRFKLNLNLGFQGGNYTANDLDAAGAYKLRKNGVDGTISVFNFNPDLRLAAQWWIAPKLALNAGGRINLRAYSWTQTEGKSYLAGDEVDNSSYKSVKAGFGVSSADVPTMINQAINPPATPSTPTGSISNELTLGVTLNATDNMGVEATCGVSNNQINVFSTTNGLFTFGSVLVTMKF
jgi:hypothetical protein